MKKPNGYDETQVGGEFTPVEVGGHFAIIKAVKEQKSSTGKDMVVVAIDFDKNDKQPAYFSDLFAKDTREEKKWPFNATQYILSEDNTGKCSRSFKSFITAFENSNNCKVKWDKGFCEQFKNKKIGVVYGEVEEEYNGEVKTRRRIRWFCDVAKAGDQAIPEKKNLPSETPKTAAPADFLPTEDSNEEIPF